MRNSAMFMLAILVSTPSFGAEVYPNKPVRVISPFAAGGATDTSARIISQQLSEQLGRAFVVENRTGAGGTIANAFVARSPADGYTLAMADPSFAIAPGLYKSLSYDPIKDFTPIAQIMRVANVVVVPPSLNANTLKELIALAQASPGKLNYGSGGVGGSVHLYTEFFKTMARVDIVHVPYKGGSDVITAMYGGQVQASILTVPTVIEQVRSGRLRALAVTTDGKRLPSMPEVPAMAEVGFPGIVIYSWNGIAGPGGMAKDLVGRLNSEINKALAVPSVKDQFTTMGFETVSNSPDEFAAHIRNELKRWVDVIKSAGIAAE